MKAIVGGGIVSAANEIQRITSYQSYFIKFWYLSIAIRIMIVYSVGQEIFSKEETSFECATKQFLCRTVCYDQFMPINYTRFWIWHTHILALTVFFFHWIRLQSVKDMVSHEYKRIQRSHIRAHSMLNLLQSIILLGIELLFAILLLVLLAKQHSPSLEFRQLVTSGELFFSPSVYVCEIEKTFSERERQMYFERKNVAFRKTPAGLRVKAQMACDQTDALCTIDRSSEKTAIVLSIIIFSSMGILALFLDLVTNLVYMCCPKRPKIKNKT